VPELVRNGESAILVPPADSESLKTAILELVLHRSRAIQLANVAFENARLFFNAARRDQRLLSIYNCVMHERLS